MHRLSQAPVPHRRGPAPWLLAAMLVLPTGASASQPQATRVDSLRVRTPVRVWASSPRFRATELELIRADADSVHLLHVRRTYEYGEPESRAYALSVGQLIRLQVPAGRRHRVLGAGRGAVKGGMVGLLAGLVVGGATLAVDPNGLTGAYVMLFAPPAGLLGGLVVGSVAGSARPGERWRTVYAVPATRDWPAALQSLAAAARDSGATADVPAMPVRVP